MIKDAIKEELLKRIKEERGLLTTRIKLNTSMGYDSLDCIAEENFLNKLEDFANSI